MFKNRKAVIKGILIGYFLLFFFSYFFFFITDNVMSGKAIYEEKQINITFPQIKTPDLNFDKQKIINYFIVFGIILIAILIIFYLSKHFHRKIVKHEEKHFGYKPFRKVN